MVATNSNRSKIQLHFRKPYQKKPNTHHKKRTIANVVIMDSEDGEDLVIAEDFLLVDFPIRPSDVVTLGASTSCRGDCPREPRDAAFVCHDAVSKPDVVCRSLLARRKITTPKLPEKPKPLPRLAMPGIIG